ncbi:MAG: hypothetical protein ACM3US_04410 [Sphingomonadaceae bacterium]
MKRNPLGVWIALAVALLLTGLLSGCGLDTRFKEVTRPLSLSFAVSYLDGRSQVSVRYSIPPSPEGKSYVLWAYDQGRKQVAKLGPVPAGVDLRAEGTAPFQVVGVVITTENSPNVTQMEGTGVIELTLEDQNLGPTAPGSRATSTPVRR